MRKFTTFITILIIIFSSSGYSQSSGKSIKLEDIYRYYRFYPQKISNIRSMKDGIHYTSLKNETAIHKYSYKTGELIESILDLSEIESCPISDFFEYEFNTDETKILLASNESKIYRYSFSADYFVYDIKTKHIFCLSEAGQQELATFSPDGKKIAFVRKNNLFCRDLESGVEKQLTKDGKINEIINGKPDWVYEEEFGFTKGFIWSPDSKQIVYYKINETGVKEFNMTMYNGLYPEWYRFKYPKAGEENSIVQIWAINLTNSQNIRLDTGDKTDQYIPRIKWTSASDTVCIFRLNRLQNMLEILHTDINTGKSMVVFSETEDQYISEVSDESIVYLDNSKEFIVTSERDGYKHLYLYNYSNKKISPITQGEFDVNEFLGVDQDNDIIYYSSHERSAINTDVYSIHKSGKNKKQISDKTGWNTAVFSSNFKYFINTYSNINQPELFTLHNNKGKEIRILEDNARTRELMEEYGFTRTEFFSFTNDENIKLNGYILKPADFNKTHKYPLFIYVYGGPERQKVMDAWSYQLIWFQYLTQHGYLVACIDNRGTDGRGEAFRKSTYMRLGKYETDDQISAAKYLGGMEYIDKERIGIFGWSYGGYLSLSCLFKAPELFKMGISVAPVTNWRYYDSVYTERFMRTPEENQKGYDENSPIHFVDGLEGKLLLIHGMGDDNVHLQNSTELIKALIDADKQFEMQFYPDKNHSINGGNTSFHVYKRMSEFIFMNL